VVFDASATTTFVANTRLQFPVDLCRDRRG
jgi:hypothetical protein